MRSRPTLGLLASSDPLARRRTWGHLCSDREPAAGPCQAVRHPTLSRDALLAAAPMWQEPRMTPRTAIAQIAKRIGQELQSGAAPSESAWAAGAMLAEDGATKDIAACLLADARRR